MSPALLIGFQQQGWLSLKRQSKMRRRNYFAILAQEAAQSKFGQFLFLTAIVCVRFHR